MAKNGPVVLIDDDKDEGEILEDVFNRQSIPNRLVCFSGGKEALHYLRTTTDKPFLILCDINMPGMNGIEIRKEINEDETCARKHPVCFLHHLCHGTCCSRSLRNECAGLFSKRTRHRGDWPFDALHL